MPLLSFLISSRSQHQLLNGTKMDRYNYVYINTYIYLFALVSSSSYTQTHTEECKHHNIRAGDFSVVFNDVSPEPDRYL